eukprot:3833108-Alexandrium_andersonii.AAC.1
MGGPTSPAAPGRAGASAGARSSSPAVLGRGLHAPVRASCHRDPTAPVASLEGELGPHPVERPQAEGTPA